MYPKPKRATPNTHTFLTYLRQIVTPQLRAHLSRPQVSVMLDLLVYLEQARYDYSADRAFQTRPLSNGQIADAFQVTTRTVRRWLHLLENLGLLTREFRKNPNHAFKNLRNRLRFCGFKDWFELLKARVSDTQCPPKRKDIKDIQLKPSDHDESEPPPPPFPDPKSLRYSPYWYKIALTTLPTGRNRPCIMMVAQKFRENLAHHSVDPSHKSVPARWAAFCKRAKPVR